MKTGATLERLGSWRVSALSLLMITAACYESNSLAIEQRVPRLLASTGSGPQGTWRYVKPEGDSGGTASTPETAWNLQWAFSGAEGELQPGDTVWLLQGDYVGTFRVSVAGTQAQPIVFRQAPGHIAVLKQNTGLEDGPPSLNVESQAHWTEFWDFEVTNTNTGPRSTSNNNAELPNAVWNQADNTKFVNLIIHDGGIGFLNDANAVGVIVSGCIIYNGGWQGPEVRGSGHGLYLRANGTFTARDNIVFNQFGYGIHVYTDADEGLLRYIHVLQNVSFNNGSLANTTSANLGNLGEPDLESSTFEKNMLYFSPSLNAGRNLVYGTGSPCCNSTKNRNYVSGGNPLIEPIPPVIPPGWEQEDPDVLSPSELKLHHPLTGGVADVNRTNLVIYSQTGQSTQLVNLGFAVGDSFEIRNAQDFRTLKYAGRYNGPFSMTIDSIEPPAPVGTQVPRAPKSTGRSFSVFTVTRVYIAPLSVAIQGVGHSSDLLKPNQTCEWNAVVSGGSGYRQYYWYKDDVLVSTNPYLDLAIGSAGFTLELIVFDRGQSKTATRTIGVSGSGQACTSS